jgi:regulator of protease activity HflC (stomatin/prohibitin superfamily)
MADISGFGPFKHLRAEASSHVLLFRAARLRRQGRGLSFWFNPFAVSLAEVPVDDREVGLAIHGRSADFQDVVVQGTLTFRIADPALAAARVDFSIDPSRGAYLRQPLEKLASMLTQLAQQRALAHLQGGALRDLVVRGHEALRAAIEGELGSSPLLGELGLELVAVRIASVKPSAEVERALEAPSRERIQEEADEATFRRRAQAVEKERAIQENELQNQIELARREQQLIEQRGQNARRDATEKVEAARIEKEGEAQRMRVGSEAQASGISLVEGARLGIERERLEIFRTMPPAVLAGLAARELAGKLTRIDHLAIAPDTLGPLLANLLEAGTRRLEGQKPAAPPPPRERQP